ncbi:MAG: hypothetical protein R3E84_09020 [Pseudomonadales bacterium]
MFDKRKQRYSAVRPAATELGIVAERRPPRVLLLDALPFDVQVAGDYEVVEDCTGLFDVVLTTTRFDEQQWEQFLLQSANPLAPLIALDPAFGDRADVLLSMDGPGDVAHAVHAVQPLLRRVQALPRLAPGPDRLSLIALGLAFTRQVPLTAGWAPDRPESVHYGLLTGVGRQRDLLERLTVSGLLRRRFFERLNTCRSCGSSRIHAREVCCRCQSSDLTEHQLLHHYACGLQAPEPVFERAGGYECPKCRKAIRHYGVDYDKPGQVIGCGACNATISEPDVAFACADCGATSDAERVMATSWHHYDLTTAGTRAVETGDLLPGDAVEAQGDLQEFRMLVRNYAHVAEREDRPLTLVRFELMEGLRPAEARAMQHLVVLIRESARKGDRVVAMEGGALAFLPETDATQARPLLERVEARVREQLADRYELAVHVIPRERILAMVGELA